MKYPGETNLERQKGEWYGSQWAQGVSQCLMSTEFLGFWQGAED